jgi:CRP/FNR family transcriptional regulator, cyclic AMP receptor protein
MKGRFQGPERRKVLVEALAAQTICLGINDLPDKIADVCELVEFNDKDVLVRQGDQSSDVYLVLTGAVRVLVGKREVARVDAGNHVGEMAAIEALPRSATLCADGVVVAAKLTEKKFTELAEAFPRMYRQVAFELVRRLERRNRALARDDAKIHVFAISSAEALPVARTGVLAFAHEKSIDLWNWPDDVFGVSNYPLEDLEAHLDKADFAIAIAQADDRTVSRKKGSRIPRDNVVFELGLFMGRLGRQHTILMKPEGVTLKLPSDLVGVTTVDYPADLSAGTASHAMSVAWERVRAHIAKVGR